MPFVRRSQPCVTYTNRGSSNYSAHSFFFWKKERRNKQDPTVHGRPSGKQREEQSAGDRGHKYLEVVEF